MADLHRYVRTPANGGNDANGGTSWEDAWASNQHAADNTNPSGYDNAYIYTAYGTYLEYIQADTYAGIDDDNRIIFHGDVENDSGDGAIRPIVDGGDSRTSCFHATKNYITFQDFEVKRAAVWNILVYASYGIVERCLSHLAIKPGISTGGVSDMSQGYTIIRNNIVYENNTVDDPVQGGIQLFNWVSYVEIYNNTIFKNKQNGVVFYSSSADRVGTGNIFKNNIGHDNTVYQIRHSDYGAYQWGITSDYNDLFKGTGTYCGHWKGTDCAALSDWQTASGQDANSQEGDPLYVNEGGKDFHIEDTDSPCYNNGTDVGVDDDYDGDDRTVKAERDIGADLILIAIFQKLVSDSGLGAEVLLGTFTKVLLDAGIGIELVNRVIGKIYSLLVTPKLDSYVLGEADLKRYFDVRGKLELFQKSEMKSRRQ